MEFLLILFVAMFIYWLVVLIYHKVTKVSYVKEAYTRSFFRDLILGSIVAAVGMLIGIFAYNTNSYSAEFGKWVLLVFPLGIAVFVLIVLDLIVKKSNWKKYTLSKFTKGATYDWEVRGAAEGFVFGLIYWDKNTSEQCSWAYMEADYNDIKRLQVEKICKVKFCSDYCFPKLNGFTGNLVVEA